MRHAGVKYLIVRDVNFLNHRGENDWISRIEKGAFRWLRICTVTVPKLSSPRLFLGSQSRALRC